MKSQNATATIGNIFSCSGDTVLAPVDVTNFIDIGAMTFYIAYDTNTSEFLSLLNINSAIPGGISSNAVNGQIGIAYSNTIPFSVAGGKLFDLRFRFLGDSTLLPFKPGTEIANSNLETIPLDTFPGSIKNSIRLIDQPDSVVQSYPDNDVIFKVTALGIPQYQWQENAGSGWNNLQNNQTYSGVNNDTLTVHDVPLSYNGYVYRCVLTADNCMVVSDEALLEVALAFPAATLGLSSSCPENNILEPLLVGDFFDVVEFTFNISFDTEFLAFQDLLNVYPEIQAGNLTTSPLVDPAGIMIHWQNSIPVSITSGKLFDLAFSYVSGNHAIAFEPGTEVTNSSFNIIDITLTDGYINQYAIPLITGQPGNDTVLENQDANFTVESFGSDEFNWQLSTDGGNSWTYLDDVTPYNNTHTPSLTISPANYDLNGYHYRCRLNNQFCAVISASATLVVDTLTYIIDKKSNGLLQVYPQPFKDDLCIILPDNYDCRQISLYDLKGMLLNSYRVNQSPGDTRDLKLNFGWLEAGAYFLKFEGYLDAQQTVEIKKILKTD